MRTIEDDQEQDETYMPSNDFDEIDVGPLKVTLRSRGNIVFESNIVAFDDPETYDEAVSCAECDKWQEAVLNGVGAQQNNMCKFIRSLYGLEQDPGGIENSQSS